MLESQHIMIGDQDLAGVHQGEVVDQSGLWRGEGTGLIDQIDRG